MKSLSNTISGRRNLRKDFACQCFHMKLLWMYSLCNFAICSMRFHVQHVYLHSIWNTKTLKCTFGITAIHWGPVNSESNAANSACLFPPSGILRSRQARRNCAIDKCFQSLPSGNSFSSLRIRFPLIDVLFDLVNISMTVSWLSSSKSIWSVPILEGSCHSRVCLSSGCARSMHRYALPSAGSVPTASADTQT